MRTIGMLFYDPAMRGVMNENNAHVLHSVSHLLCAMLALGSATCSTLNSMFITLVSAREECAIVTQRGGAIKFIMRNFHVCEYHKFLMNIGK